MRPWKRLVVAVATAAAVATMFAGAAQAGEVTGNGKLLKVTASKWGTGLHARSLCAFSGQEDLQYFTDDSDTVAKEPTKGDPSHSQSWGRIPKDIRDELTTFGLQPGTSCNPMRSGGEP